MELPARTWHPLSQHPGSQDYTKCTFLFHLSLFLSLCHITSFLFIPSPSLFLSYLMTQRSERKGRSILGKTGQVTRETKILRHPYSFSSHIILVLLIILLRALTSSFPWPLALRQEQVTGQVPWAQQRFTLPDALLEFKLNTGTGSQGDRNGTPTDDIQTRALS